MSTLLIISPKLFQEKAKIDQVNVIHSVSDMIDSPDVVYLTGKRLQKYLSIYPIDIVVRSGNSMVPDSWLIVLFRKNPFHG